MAKKGQTWVRKGNGITEGYRWHSRIRVGVGFTPEMYKTIAKHAKRNKLTMVEQVRRLCHVALCDYAITQSLSQNR